MYINIPEILLGSYHIFLGIFTALYSFIIKQSLLYDFIYVAYTMLVFILWCLYDGCPITYYYYKYTKKIDYEAVINTNSYLYIIGDNILDIILLFSIYIAATRSKIMPLYFVLLYLFLKLLFNFFIKKNTLFVKIKQNEIIKGTRPYSMKLILIINILLLFYIFYKNKNRLLKTIYNK